MSSPTAKDLLAQADRLMRQRTPEELPVLTDLVIEEIDIPSLSERMDEVIPTRVRASWMPAQGLAPSPNAVAPTPPPLATALATQPITPPAQLLAPGLLERSAPLAALFSAHSQPSQDRAASASISGGPNTNTAMASVREQFNEQLLARLEELQHSVFSQVMQKLEIHAAGSLKTHLQKTLEPALMGIARELAEQVAEDTAAQVREVVSNTMDAEIARLREQLAKKRF